MVIPCGRGVIVLRYSGVVQSSLSIFTTFLALETVAAWKISICVPFFSHSLFAYWLGQSVALLFFVAGLYIKEVGCMENEAFGVLSVMTDQCVLFVLEAGRCMVHSSSLIMNIHSAMSSYSYLLCFSSIFFGLWWSWGVRTAKSMVLTAVKSLAASLSVFSSCWFRLSSILCIPKAA